MVSEILDNNISKFLAQKTGIPAEQHSVRIAGQGIGTGIEMIENYFTKGWLNMVLKGGMGLAIDLYTIFGHPGDTRLRAELLQIGDHLAWRWLELIAQPQYITGFFSSIDQTLRAVKKGDTMGALASVIKTPNEIGAMFGLTMRPPAPPVPSQTTQTTSTPSTTPEPEAAPTTNQGRYLISE